MTFTSGKELFLTSLYEFCTIYFTVFGIFPRRHLARAIPSLFPKGISLQEIFPTIIMYLKFYWYKYLNFLKWEDEAVDHKITFKESVEIKRDCYK